MGTVVCEGWSQCVGTVVFEGWSQSVWRPNSLG